MSDRNSAGQASADSAPGGALGGGSEQQVQIPVIPYLPEDVRIEFADGLSVSHSEHHFIISFLQLQYPILSGEQLLEAAPDMTVRNRCIARIAVAAGRLPVFIDVLQRQVEKQRADTGAPETHETE